MPSRSNARSHARSSTRSAVEPIAGRFLHVVFSPHGGVEGVMLEVGGAPLQIVFEHHDEVGPRAFEPVTAGQAVVVDAVRQPPSPKGEGEHPVFAYRRLRTVDGGAPQRPAKTRGAAYVGVVVRLNHARHGAPNGVVLDSGHFIHLRPEGFARLGLRVGDRVEADGDAHWLATGGGWAVEATKVNGRSVKPR